MKRFLFYLLLPDIFPKPGTFSKTTGTAFSFAEIECSFAASSAVNHILLSRLPAHRWSSFCHIYIDSVLLCEANVALVHF